jgi:hypothetical protein
MNGGKSSVDERIDWWQVNDVMASAGKTISSIYTGRPIFCVPLPEAT